MQLLIQNLAKQQQYIHSFASLAILLVSSVVVSRIFKKIPKLSSYVIAGILVGPYGLKWITVETIESLEYITHFGLGMIAFMIGMEFHRSSIKNLDKIGFITIFQALTTMFAITCGVYFLGLATIQISLVLGVIGAATAPGPIILFVKSKGIKKSTLKNLLLPVIALDDAVTVILYALVLGLVDSSSISLSTNMLVVAKHLVYSIGIGIGIGVFLGFFKNLGETREKYLTYSIAAISAGLALSYWLHASYIITLIVCGIVFTNFIDKKAYFRQEKSLQNFNPPIFTLFYSMAGALLPIRSIGNFIIIVIAYIVLRVIGKTIGFYTSSRIMKVDKKVSKYIGLASLPQAGVAIGLATSLPEPFRTHSLPTIIGAVFVFQLVGPWLVEYSFKKAGNYHPDKAKAFPEANEHYDFTVGSIYNQSTKRNIFERAAEIVNRVYDDKHKK